MKPNPFSALKNFTVPCATDTHFSARQANRFGLLATRNCTHRLAEPWRGSMDHRRLTMPLGEAMFTQRSIRRFKPDAIPLDDIQLILEAAAKAPNGGNQQIARFL